MTTNDFDKPADRVESVDPKGAPIERTAATQDFSLPLKALRWKLT
jgi:hypothetical protein